LTLQRSILSAVTIVMSIRNHRRSTVTARGWARALAAPTTGMPIGDAAADLAGGVSIFRTRRPSRMVHVI
jgi:hypothetical protein